jgi:patatin-related protein
MARAEDRNDAAVMSAVREVRLAVVLYGGSSLAVYINGVAQELLHLVRATAPGAQTDGELRPLLDDGSLRETERVYRWLGQLIMGDEHRVEFIRRESAPIRTRFVVDIISGTSAGGINGIFLAKALATERSIDELKNLWVREGDIGLLINDKESGRGLPGVEVKDPPQSLLNGQRMYLKLLQAFEGMDRDEAPSGGSSPGEEEKQVESRLVEQLDLFVTTTDLSGLVLPIELADGVIGEPRHRNVYHFVYSTETASGDYRNDFVPRYNPFLAFAARCTSSLPFVFEPIRLVDIDPIVKTFDRFANDGGALSGSERWHRFFTDYLVRGEDGKVTTDFPQRAFGDGGSLDNAPFSYATEDLTRRRADLPVDRKLLYVEPDPRIYRFGEAPGAAPHAILNLLEQMVLLPRTETIREDLDRILTRNRQIERIQRVLTPLDQDARNVLAGGQGQPPERIPEEQLRRMYLEELIPRFGVSYGTYQRLRVAEVTDQLARLFTRLAGLNESSDHFLAIRYLVRAWRDRHYAHSRQDAAGLKEQDGLERAPFAALLLDLDTTFEMRRLRFLLEAADRLLADEAGAELPAPARAMRLREVLAVKQVVNDAFKDIRMAGRTARKPRPGNPVFDELARRKLSAELRDRLRPDRGADGADTGTLAESLNQILTAGPDEEACQRKAAEVEEPLDDSFRALAGTLTTQLRPDMERVRAMLREEFQSTPEVEAEADDIGGLKAPIRAELGRSYDYFTLYDLLAYPIQYGTDVGEADIIDVHRVSPKDATDLIDVRRDPDRIKVGGAQFGHFGAFFDRLWRENDILWGRLDAAERLIKALVPQGPARDGNVEALCTEAFGEILWTELTESDKAELAGLMATALAQLSPEDRTAQGLADFIRRQNGGPLEARLDAVLRAVIQRRDLVDYYRTGFTLDTRLSKAPAMRNAARATHVLGQVLKGISETQGLKPLVSPMAWVARTGRLLTGVVEAATPGNTMHLLVRHWLVLAFLIEGTLIAGGILLGQPAAQHLGWSLLWFTLGLTVLIAFLSGFIRGAVLWKAILRVVLALALLAAITMIALEVPHLGTDVSVGGRSVSRPPVLPFEEVTVLHPWRLLGIGLFTAVLASILMTLHGRKLRLPVVRGGIVSFELAGSRGRAREILTAWKSAGKTGWARWDLGLDLVYILVYAPALYLAVTWSTAQWRDLWPFGAWVGFVLAWMQLVAGALDALEDTLLLTILGRSDPGDQLPRLARTAAQTKFLLVGLGLAYFLAALARHPFA